MTVETVELEMVMHYIDSVILKKIEYGHFKPDQNGNTFENSTVYL